MSTPTVRCGDCKFFTDDFPVICSESSRSTRKKMDAV